MSRMEIEILVLPVRLTDKLLLFFDELLRQIKRGVEAERYGAAFYAVLPIVAVGVPSLGCDYVCGVSAGDPGEAENAFTVLAAGGEGGNDGVREFGAEILLLAAVIMAVELQSFVKSEGHRLLYRIFA